MVRADVIDNWRAYVRALVLVLAAAAAAVLLNGCGGAGELEQLEPSDDAGDELEQLEPCEPPAPDPILSLPAHRCEGHWADNSDSSTRFTAHPDTGLCTFACVWEDPRCDEPWFGDPRCFPAHAAVLGGLCAELGGSCELNAERTNRYCVAVP